MTSALYSRIAANVQEIRERIHEAARKTGRTGNDVRLVAVSKYAEAGDGMVEALLAAQCFELGEARPQRLLEKAACYTEQPIQWHLVGALQRNKARKVLPVISLLQSLDSLRLAEAIDRIAEVEHLPPVRCLLEVAISQDTEKQGVPPENVWETLDKIGQYKNIIVEGLMGMSGLESNESQTRHEFETLRQTAEAARAELVRGKGLPPNVTLRDLSMGMSGDFEIAIEEGATIVRIGSILYR